MAQVPVLPCHQPLPLCTHIHTTTRAHNVCLLVSTQLPLVTEPPRSTTCCSVPYNDATGRPERASTRVRGRSSPATNGWCRSRMNMTSRHHSFTFFPHAIVVVSSRAIVPVFVVCDMPKAEEGSFSTVTTILWHKLLWIRGKFME